MAALDKNITDDSYHIHFFKIECLHQCFLTTSDAYWCNECEDWIYGNEPVAYAQVKWNMETGEIRVQGDGYATSNGEQSRT